jgi:hypothetical protein
VNSEAHVTANSTGRMHMDQLPNFVAHAFSLPGREATCGEKSLAPIPGSPPPFPKRRLNPFFVEFLMGWPFGWTIPEPMPFAARATELWHCRLRQHLAILLED